MAMRSFCANGPILLSLLKGSPTTKDLVFDKNNFYSTNDLARLKLFNAAFDGA